MTNNIIVVMVVIMFAIVYIMGRCGGRTSGYKIGIKDGYVEGLVEGIDQGKQQILKENIARLRAQHKFLAAERCTLSNCQGAEDATILKSIIKEANHA